MRLACSHLKEVQFLCHQDAKQTTIKRRLIIKGQQVQAYISLMDSSKIRRGKSPWLKCKHMMIFADGAGDMGNLKNRKTNIDSRYF